MKDIYDFAYPSRSAVLNAHKRNRNALDAGETSRDVVAAIKRYGNNGRIPAKAFDPERLEWGKESSTQGR